MMRDLFIRLLPDALVPKKFKQYTFCFLGHPRDYDEVYRKYRFLKGAPRWMLRLFLNHIMWPTTIAPITGLVSLNDGGPVRGCVMSVPMTAQDLLKSRRRALRKIKRAVRHARKQGVVLMGLAGYTASLTRGGLDLQGMGVGITTGHAYTALNVVQNYQAILNEMQLGVDAKTIPVAIVGAAGSVGSTVAKYLATQEVAHVTLVDLDRKLHKVEELANELRLIHPEGVYQVTSDMSTIKQAVVVFTATNAAEALITPERTVPGMIFVDDTQPTDISKETHHQDDVLVLEAGAVRTPGVRTHFKFGLQHPEDNFCCMAELLILSASGHSGDYVINRATLDHVYEMESRAKEIGFRIGEFQNMYNTVTPETIQRVAQLIKERLR